MSRVVVNVMPKPEILDPQGKATTGALARLGHGKFENVRIGKRFELSVEGPITDEIKAEVRELAEQVLEMATEYLGYPTPKEV